MSVANMIYLTGAPILRESNLAKRERRTRPPSLQSQLKSNVTSGAIYSFTLVRPQTGGSSFGGQVAPSLSGRSASPIEVSAYSAGALRMICRGKIGAGSLFSKTLHQPADR